MMGEWHRVVIIWIATLTGYCLGGENYNALIILLVLIVIDFVTGVIASYKINNAIRSAKLPATAIKTVVYFSIIVTSRLTGNVLDLPSIEKLIIMFYVATEAYSIIENAHLLGIPIPQMFQDAIKRSIEKKTKKEKVTI